MGGLGIIGIVIACFAYQRKCKHWYHLLCTCTSQRYMQDEIYGSNHCHGTGTFVSRRLLLEYAGHSLTFYIVLLRYLYRINNGRIFFEPFTLEVPVWKCVHM